MRNMFMSKTYIFLEVFRKTLLDNTYVIKGGRELCSPPPQYLKIKPDASRQAYICSPPSLPLLFFLIKIA